MKSLIIFIAIVFSSIPSNGQSLNNEHIIELGKHFSNFMFRNEPPEIILDELGENYSEDMIGALKFIKEITISDNDILDTDFLTLPDSNTLRIVFIIDALHQNPHRKTVYEPHKLIDSLKKCDIPYVELVDEYYSTLFTSVGNKNNPFDLSDMNFKMKEYGLINDRLKGIFYLRCMEFCGSQIFGFMNIVKPPNTSKALDIINDFPKFDHLKYYQYTDLYFEDFDLEIINDKQVQSYKGFFIDKLYSTLLNHLICLNKEDEDEETITDLLLGSILKDRSLYKYTSHKELLEQLFEEQ
ncbi:MAG: hypothetical protein CVV25_09660 [Ignavibacteriae bacterium HGW-Ignavibacteriae-4]|jgi:hypothetical protein|nr:MAG: hypothetical protein CVV25_09660 [Ignavibacteriae bacterium HGW-Ignavibacteriae-4]